MIAKGQYYRNIIDPTIYCKVKQVTSRRITYIEFTTKGAIKCMFTLSPQIFSSRWEQIPDLLGVLRMSGYG